jgi:hypothetical protein
VAPAIRAEAVFVFVDSYGEHARMIDTTTLDALANFPRQLEVHYAVIPVQFKHWAPPTWDTVPSEPFTAIEQICHVRDIEIDGYHSRFRRTLDEDFPLLPGVDGFALASERSYATADAAEVLAAFRKARAQTVQLLSGLGKAELARPAIFEDYGATTLRGLVHYLCSHDQQHLAGLQWLRGKIEGPV